MNEVRPHLEKHLDSIFALDLETYRATTSSDLTVYQWYLTPHRIDGIDFHLTTMGEASREGGGVMAWDQKTQEGQQRAPISFLRYDLANYREQRHGDTAVCSYTLLITRKTPQGVKVRSHNETRILVKQEEAWVVVHVHKSPAWNAPFAPPNGD